MEEGGGGGTQKEKRRRERRRGGGDDGTRRAKESSAVCAKAVAHQFLWANAGVFLSCAKRLLRPAGVAARAGASHAWRLDCAVALTPRGARLGCSQASQRPGQAPRWPAERSPALARAARRQSPMPLLAAGASSPGPTLARLPPAANARELCASQFACSTSSPRQQRTRRLELPRSEHRVWSARCVCGGALLAGVLR